MGRSVPVLRLGEERILTGVASQTAPLPTPFPMLYGLPLQYCDSSIALAVLRWQYCDGSIAIAVDPGEHANPSQSYAELTLRYAPDTSTVTWPHGTCRVLGYAECLVDARWYIDEAPDMHICSLRETDIGTALLHPPGICLLAFNKWETLYRQFFNGIQRHDIEICNCHPPSVRNHFFHIINMCTERS